jgi:hypothetical protein
MRYTEIRQDNLPNLSVYLCDSSVYLCVTSIFTGDNMGGRPPR